MMALNRNRPRRAVRPATHVRVVPDQSELVRQLYDEHAGPLLAYVSRLTAGDLHRAEDIVQETLFRAWRNVDSLTPERGSVRGWLMRVAHNVTIDSYRARQARPTELGSDQGPDPAVLDRSDEVLTSVEVKRALAQLSPDHRAVLVEVYFKDRTAVEAARTLNVPVGTVKSRTYYALRLLRLMMDEEREERTG